MDDDFDSTCSTTSARLLRARTPWPQRGPARHLGAVAPPPAAAPRAGGGSGRRNGRDAPEARKRRRKSKNHRIQSHPKLHKSKNHLAAASDPSFHLKSSAFASSRTSSYLVQPLGNLLLSATPRANLRDASLGTLHQLLDELILDVLGTLPARDLATLSAVSKALYVVASHGLLWRLLVHFAGTWRATYIAAVSGGRASLPSRIPNITGFYSDYLFLTRGWQ